MIEDSELLRRYAQEGSEAAFTDLVQRHVDLVYSAALRQVYGDHHRAEDVTQAVFADLARKADSLCRHPTLRGWLYTSTHFAATKSTRAERRRLTREKEALLMQEVLHDSAPAPNWNQFRPILDGAMHELDERQRETLLLRFFDKRPFAAIAEKLGVSENAARKSVNRALEKLADLLARRGVTSTVAALSLTLAENAVVAAPAGFVSSVSAAALGAAGSGGGFALAGFMAKSKLSTGAFGALVLAGTGILFYQYRANAALAGEIGGLQRQLAPTAAERPPDAIVPSGNRLSPAPISPAAPTSGRAPQPEPAVNLKLASDWRNAGRATPEAVVETYMWSVKEKDFDAFLTTWGGLDAAGTEIAQAYFATLPDDIRAKYGTPDRLIARLMMWAGTARPVAGFAITGVEMVTPNEAQVQVRERLPNGNEQTLQMGTLYRTSDGWRGGQMPASNVEKALYGGRYLLKFENLPSPTTPPPAVPQR